MQNARTAAAVAWCSVVGWFAFARHGRVPLIGLADLGFHELGHLIFYVVPAGDFVTAIAGSGLQITVPLLAASYFVILRRDAVAGACCLAWASANFADVSRYIADAPYERLELIGGQHDWAYLLGPEQLNRLHDAGRLASLCNGTGRRDVARRDRSGRLVRDLGTRAT